MLTYSLAQNKHYIRLQHANNLNSVKLQSAVRVQCLTSQCNSHINETPFFLLCYTHLKHANEDHIAGN